MLLVLGAAFSLGIPAIGAALKDCSAWGEEVFGGELSEIGNTAAPARFAKTGGGVEGALGVGTFSTRKHTPICNSL